MKPYSASLAKDPKDPSIAKWIRKDASNEEVKKLATEETFRTLANMMWTEGCQCAAAGAMGRLSCHGVEQLVNADNFLECFEGQGRGICSVLVRMIIDKEDCCQRTAEFTLLRLSRGTMLGDSVGVLRDSIGVVKDVFPALVDLLRSKDCRYAALMLIDVLCRDFNKLLKLGVVRGLRDILTGLLEVEKCKKVACNLMDKLRIGFYDGYYVGDTVDGFPHGNGECSFYALHDISKYTGDWINGFPHGHGTFYYHPNFYRPNFIFDVREAADNKKRIVECSSLCVYVKYEGDVALGQMHGAKGKIFARRMNPNEACRMISPPVSLGRRTGASTITMYVEGHDDGVTMNARWFKTARGQQVLQGDDEEENRRVLEDEKGGLEEEDLRVEPDGKKKKKDDKE